jgi:serine/threonine protein kinase
VRELLVLELDYRQKAGERPGVDEYRRRLPADGDVIGAVFRELTAAPAAQPALSDPHSSSVSAQSGDGTQENLPAASSNRPEPQAGPLPLPEQFGRYRIIKPLGQGGMGAVYLAQDTKLDRQVALKVPRFTGDDGPLLVERFYREARAAATLQHPNICPVYDVGEINGSHYLTMAYIEGKSLATYVRPGKQHPQRQAAALVRKLALALAAAHGRG